MQCFVDGSNSRNDTAKWFKNCWALTSFIYTLKLLKNRHFKTIYQNHHSHAVVTHITHITHATQSLTPLTPLTPLTHSLKPLTSLTPHTRSLTPLIHSLTISHSVCTMTERRKTVLQGTESLEDNCSYFQIKLSPGDKCCCWSIWKYKVLRPLL